MDLSDLVTQKAILPALKAGSKKQLMQLLSEKAAEITGLGERDIFDTIMQREKLGSTGVGSGIAIPHGKLKNVKSITGLFARLETPVDFEALDDEPVDLVFLQRQHADDCFSIWGKHEYSQSQNDCKADYHTSLHMPELFI